MTAQEKKQLSDLLEKAIRGDEQAISDVCEFIEMHMKQETLNRLSRAGVGSYLEEACQEILLTVQQRLPQLRVVDAFESWLRRLEMSVARRLRPRCARYSKSIQVLPQAFEQPREVSAKTIQVDGKPEIARIFEPPALQEQSPRRPFFEPVTDVILAKASMSNRLNYLRTIDVRRALAKLPKRWARVIYLLYFAGYSRTEAAKIMGCSKGRIFKLTQKAKNRLRRLLTSYDQNGLATLHSRSCKAIRRARKKRALPIPDISPNASAFRVSTHVRVGLRHQ